VARGRIYTPGKRVPGENNAGIIATRARTFEAFISYDGKRFTAGTHETLEEVRAARDARLRELQGKGTATSLRAQRTTLAEYVESTFWTNHYNTKARPKRPSTMRAAVSRYHTYIEPHFGHRALVHITRFVIIEFTKSLAEGVYEAPEFVERMVHDKVRAFRPRRADQPSGKTQREVLLLVRAILTAAAEDKNLIENPFPPKIIPSGRPEASAKKKSARLDPNDILKIVSAIPSLKHRCIAAVLAYVGLRLGEALAVRWGDVDFRRGYISVEQSADAKTREIGPPKTERGIRDVPLDPALAKHLKAYRRSIRPSPHASDLLFPARHGTDVQVAVDQRVFVQRHWDVARAKVTTKRITPHTARHLWCSVMVTLFPVADVSMWAGHHSASFTYDRYVKPLEQLRKTSPLKRSIYGTKGR
jgi:integrase